MTDKSWFFEHGPPTVTVVTDYDRLRADVLALRYALVSQHGYSVSDARRLLDDLIEKHPAREVPMERHCSECDPSFSCFLGRAPCSKVPPPTPARATAISELVTALTLSNAPLGTRAPAIGGGHWERVKHGWKWCTGDTFPRPGGDWNGKLMPPPQAKAPQLSREEVELIEWAHVHTRAVVAPYNENLAKLDQLITRLRAASSPKDNQ